MNYVAWPGVGGLGGLGGLNDPCGLGDFGGLDLYWCFGLSRWSGWDGLTMMKKLTK